MPKIQQSNIVTRGEDWLLQQSYVDGIYVLQKHIPNRKRKKNAQLHYEFELIQKLKLQMMLQPKSIEQDEQFMTMTYETDEPYMPLTQLLGKPLQVTAFLKLAMQLTNCFIELHQVSHIYQNFHPQHVFINKSNNIVKFINFEQSFKYSHHPTSIEHELDSPLYRIHYMAPEETGRVNSSVDFQTDLYALGAIFYELLCGRPIFEGNDDAVLYQLLTKEPRRFNDLGIDVPIAIENIVFKLLSKEKKNRYQSAIGLKEDLSICWYKLTNQIPLTPFQLAKYDEHGKWQLSFVSPTIEKMKQEIVTRIDEGQRVQVISGPQYSGKTFLLKQLELHFMNGYNSSYLLTAKLEGNTLNIPVIFLAIRKKIQQLKQNNQIERINEHSTWLAYIPNSIIYFLPELRMITSQLRFAEEQEYIEQYQLFQVTIQIIDYLNIHSVETIFLVDEYEELDHFTKDFIHFTLTQYSNNRFVFTAGQNQQLQPVIEDLPYVTVSTMLLSKEQIFEWLSESLKDHGQVIEECAMLLYDVSNGIPLYVETFFNDFCELQILKYNIHDASWQLDVTKTHSLDLKNYNVFINDTLNGLSEQQRLVVQYAVGLGARFDVVLLFKIVPLPYEETLQLFLQLVKKRIFVLSPEQFSMLELLVDLNLLQEFDIVAQFFNDDMLQLARKLMTMEQLKDIHLKIVEHLVQQTLTTTEQKRRLWHHMKMVEERLTEQQLLMYLTLSNELGNVTLKNGVFQEAMRFSQVFETVMPDSYWQNHYRLALEGYILNANALYLNNEIELAKPLFELLLTRAKTIEDKLFVYNETILFLTFSQVELPVTERLHYILELAREALALVGIKMPKKNLNFHILKEYMALKQSIHKKSDQELLQLPKISNTQIDLALQILMNVSGVVFILNDKLYVWGVMRGLRLIQKFGDQVYGCFFYGSYSNILVAAFKDYENAYRFGRLSIEHLESYDNILFKGNIYMNFGGSTSFLKDPYERSIYYLYQTQQHSIPNTLHDLYNGTAAAYILIYRQLQGASVVAIKKEYEEQRKYLQATTNPIMQTYCKELVHWLDILQNESSKIDWNFVVAHKTRVSYWESHLILRLQMSYLLCEDDQGQQLIEELNQFIKHSQSRPERPYYYFYKALTISRQYEKTLDIARRSQMHKEIQRCIKELKKFSIIGSVNHEHLLKLIEAIKYRLTQQPEKAKLYFDRAIQLARHNENARDEAIAQLNAALFYNEMQELQKANRYMQRALELLYRWGAPYVVTILSAKYSFLLQQEQLLKEEQQTKPFNVAPIVNMYQRIAQEEKVDQLAQVALMEMMTQMDATQIHLIKVNVDEFYPLASANSEDESFCYYNEQPTYLPPSVNVDILQEVVSSKSYIVRNDVNDEHKSVIALAVFNKGQITAIVYAVNYVMSAIFTKSKIDIVTILATQFLIALENIERQTQLELVVQKRTEELSDLNAQLQEMNAHLLQSEQERKYFLQHISHDLRSPITSVLGYVEALQSGIVTAEEKKLQYLQRSKVRLVSLQHLIKDLFDMTQLEGGRMQLQFEQITVEQLVVFVEELLEFELTIDTLTFVSESFIGTEPMYVQVDIERILQVFQNFSSNIIKYANEGIVHVHFIVVEQALTITISDQGIGIPEKDLPFIFDMHYVGSNHSRKESYGIGMTICKRIIELHSGTIGVTSTVGKGTTFTVDLPLIK